MKRHFIKKLGRNEDFRLLIVKIILFLMTLGLLVDQKVILRVFQFQNAIIFKLVLLLLIFVFFDQISIGIYGLTKTTKESKTTHKNLFGIEVHNIVEYLSENNHFKYEELREMFGITPQNYKQFGDILEKDGILERGQNNSRVLVKGINDEILMKYFDDYFSTTPSVIRENNNKAIVT